MAKKKNPEASVEYGRLSAPFIDLLRNGRIEEPTKKDVFGVPGGKRHESGAEHAWRPMLDGDPVQWRYIQALLKYLLENKKIDSAQVLTAAERVDPDTAQMFDPYYPDIWILGWEGIKTWLGEANVIPAESFCYIPTDFEEMADIILDCIGRKGSYRGHTLTDDAARTAGERFAGLNRDGFVTWLSALHAKNRFATMFAVANVIHGPRRCNRRVGVTLILPLTEASYNEFRAGDIPYPQLSAGDIVSEGTPSQHLLLHSFSELPSSKESHQKKISQAQIRTALYQLAVHAPLQLRKNVAPKLLCLAPLPEHVERAVAYGFDPLPAIEQATKSHICELLPSFKGSYIALISMLCGWQWLHRPEANASHPDLLS